MTRDNSLAGDESLAREDALVVADHEALLAQASTLAEMAREEDLGRGDITSGLLPDSRERGVFRVVNREAGVFAGREITEIIVHTYTDDVVLNWGTGGVDGFSFGAEAMSLLELSGPVGLVLTLERVLLNFLQRLCGIATKTRRFVDAVEGTGVRILDTRKTTPGWRHLEKYAVRCGGGRNHRMGLHDAVLIKDNHLSHRQVEHMPVEQTLGGQKSGEQTSGGQTSGGQTSAVVFEMLNRIANLDPPPVFVEVEADTLDQVRQLFSVVGIDVVLLDNFSPGELREAVALRESLDLADKVKLEASGGVTLDTVSEIARTGIDYISVGALTHSAVAVDLALDHVR